MQRPESSAGRRLRWLLVLLTAPVVGVGVGLVPASAASTPRAASAVSATALVPAAFSAARASGIGAFADLPTFKVDKKHWWTYETLKRESQLSGNVDYDFAAKMAEEIDKVAEKAIADKIDKISRFLNLLATAIAVFVKSHPYAAAIVAFLAAVVAALGAKKVAQVVKWIRGILYRGKHRRAKVWANGFWADVFTFTDGPPNGVYKGWTARTCPASRVSCGSPADMGKEYWP